MTDLQAAVGRPQLARLDAIVAERRRLAARYAQAFAGDPVVAPPALRAGTRTNWQSYPLSLRDGVDQRAVLQGLLDRGIACKPGISNAHEEPAYAGTSRWRGGPLPVSERLRRTTILVPLFHGMTEAEQDAVIAAVRAVSREVRS
jgi:dTDP-4-amino-4,6-dideoxygalactose transaminase